MLAPGDLVEGRYRVERLIGEGGMGAVYAVRDASGAAYALKVLLDASNELLRKRFVREGKAAAALSSAHATRVFGSGTLDDGAPYLLMELLAGEDLWDVVHKRGPLSAQHAVDYILQAGEALTEAHRLGMVHRDIKPANLFLATQPDGTRCVKLLDFGISKTALSTVAPMTQLTQTGSVLGSPEYMSPEQLLSSSDVDARADVWSMGATLHELLSASNAFAGDTLAEIVTAIMRDAPRPLREVRPDLSPALEAVVLRCLEKDPELRFSSMEELAQALRLTVPTRFEAAPTLAGYAQRSAPSAFESSPTLAPSTTQHAGHAQTVAHGSDGAAAAGALRPDTRGAQAPTLPGAVTWPSRNDPRSTQAPTVVNAPPPVTPSPAGPAQPRRRWPLLVAGFLGLGVVGGLGTLAIVRARGGDQQARSEDDGADDDPDDDADAAKGLPPNGDRTLPKAKRVALLLAVKRAEDDADQGQRDAADDKAERVLGEIEKAKLKLGAHRSPIASRAEHVRTRVAGAEALDLARGFDSSQDLQPFILRLSTLVSESHTHGTHASLWDGLSRACPLVTAARAHAEVSRELMVKAVSAAQPTRLPLHVYAGGIAQSGLSIITYHNGQPGRSARCVSKLAAMRAPLQELRDAAEARRDADADGAAPSPPPPAPPPRPRRTAPNSYNTGF